MKSNKSKVALLGIIMAALLSMMVVLTYSLLKKSVTNIIVSSTDELAQHDMQSIQGYVADRINAVQHVVDVVIYNNPDNVEDMMELLHIETVTSTFTKIGLIDADGQVYTDIHIILPKEQNSFLEYFDGSCGKQFARRYDGQEYDDEFAMQYLLYGIDFSDTPLHIAGVQFIGAVALNYTSEIQKQMRISLFGDKGYSSIINREGYYIVEPDDRINPERLPNFFEMIGDRVFQDGYNLDRVHRKVSDMETFSFSTIDHQGRERFISIMPIENSNWCFINAIDTSVFKQHTDVFVRITVYMLAAMTCLLFGGIGFYFYSASRLEKLYTTTVEGVYNRKYYNEQLKGRQFHAFIMIDLDHLKQINDGFGHLAGDLAIASAAQTIRQRVGSMGEVVRYGGDEFAVVFHKKPEETAFSETIQQIMDDIRKVQLSRFPEVQLSLSIGGHYGSGESEALLTMADALLYQAKKTRNCAVTNLMEKEDSHV